MSEQTTTTTTTTTIRTCPDGHRCENGSTCVQHPTDEGKYYCDCDTGSGDLSGLFCEYEAETYCQLQQQTSSDWFCTNKGTCVFSTESSQSGGSQWDCDCPTNFEGPHCQFVAGNVPRDWPGYDFDPDTGTLASATRTSTRDKGGGLHVAVSIFIGVAVAVVVALVGFFVVHKIRNREIGSATQNSTRDHSEAVNKLEPDGGVMQGALASFARTPNSTIKSNNNNTNQQEQEPFDAKSLTNGLSHDTSVEMGFYSDKPLSRPKNSNRGSNLL